MSSIFISRIYLYPTISVKLTTFVLLLKAIINLNMRLKRIEKVSENKLKENELLKQVTYSNIV